MTAESGMSTSPTLLGRLACVPVDQAAWTAFVQRYGPLIYRWCRHWGLQQADAEDITQQVLLKLAEKMRTFTYDPARSFRAWLKTVTHHAWQDSISRRRAGIGTGSEHVQELLDSVQARDDLVTRLDDEFARELLDEAMARVRSRVQGHTWQAFHLLAVEGLSGAEAAARLNMKVATVFVAKSKVQKMIRDQVSQLEQPGSSPAEVQVKCTARRLNN